MKTRDVYQLIFSSDMGQSPHRLEAFFDAVYAIALTILVLGLSLPEHSENLSVYQIFEIMLPQLYHFAIAFFILGAFWATHHRLFVLVKKANSMLVRLTFVTLFITCLLPFTSTLAGDNHTDPLSVIFFHVNLFVLGLLFLFQWIYVIRAGLSVPVPTDLFRFILVRSSMVPFIALLAIALAFYYPALSSASYLLIFVCNFILLFFKPKTESSEPDNIIKISKTIMPLNFEKNHEIHSLLTDVSEEMGLAREDLVMKILDRWKNEMRVNTGEKKRLCNLSPDTNH